MTVRNRSCPTNAMVARLLYADPAAAIDWLARAFGFEELYRYVEPDGRVTNAQMRLGEASIMLGGPVPQAPAWNRNAATLVMVVVDDVEAHHARAAAAGAQIVVAPTASPFGERHYSAVDPEGRTWWFTQHVADVDPREWGAMPAGRAAHN